MSLRVIVPPAASPLSLGEAKSHLNYFESDQDAKIAGCIAQATAYLDGPEGRLGRCLIEQTLELTVDCFPRYTVGYETAIPLPLPPLIAVDAITYIDQDGTTQTLDPAVYQVVGIGSFGAIYPVYRQPWPAARHQPEAVRVVYRAGYGGWNEIPEHVRAAILLIVGDLFSHRENLEPGEGFRIGAFDTGLVERLLGGMALYKP